MHTIGAEVIQYAVDNTLRDAYVVDIPRVNSGLERYQNKVPCFFTAPEDSFQDYILPSIVFKQNDATPAFERQPWFSVAARGPAKDAEEVKNSEGDVIGYTKYETQLRGDPYDITYDMILYARRKQELNEMIMWVMRITRPPWFVFKVIDSLGDVRQYDAGEVSFSNTSELADIADRTQSWTISFTVRAEIDTYDDIEMVAMTEPQTSAKPL